MNIPKDQMTPLERMIAYGSGKAYDRMPCTPMVSTAFTHELGYSTVDYYKDPKVMSSVAIEGYRAASSDSVSFGAILHGLAQGLGCDFQLKALSVPVIENTIENIYERTDDIDPQSGMSGRIVQVSLEALKRTIDTLGKEVVIGSSIAGPLTTASFMIGAEKLLKDMRRQPENVHRVLRLATDATLPYIDAMNALGIRCSLADPVSSCTLISKKNFEVFSQPYLKECMDRIMAFHGKGSTVHICGKSQPIWDNLIEIGAASISIDNEEDLGVIRESHGERICIAGNVDPVNVLRYGTADMIYENVRVAIEKGRGSQKGFILSSGCGVPIETPIASINHMLDATRLYGQYSQ